MEVPSSKNVKQSWTSSDGRSYRHQESKLTATLVATPPPAPLSCQVIINSGSGSTPPFPSLPFPARCGNISGKFDRTFAPHPWRRLPHFPLSTSSAWERDSLSLAAPGSLPVLLVLTWLCQTPHQEPLCCSSGLPHCDTEQKTSPQHKPKAARGHCLVIELLSESLGLEGTSVDHPVQTSCQGTIT